MGTYAIYAAMGIVGIAGLVALVLIGRALRGNMDLVALHSRELLRYVIAFALVTGTLAGTLWAFSGGRLTLSGPAELWVTVGGIGAALEVGDVYFGLAIQQLDARIKSAKRKGQAEDYAERRKTYYRWFAGMLAVSFLANFWFRWQQLGGGWDLAHAGNDFAVCLVTSAPIVLIIVFTIVLRPLPPDYAEMGRQTYQRGLVMLTRTSQGVMLRHLRAMGRGQQLSEAQMQQLMFAASVSRMHASADEQQVLDHAIGQAGGATVVEGTAEQYVSSADVSEYWGVPQRTAQLWVSQAPGRRKASKGNAWLAPVGAITREHGYARLELAPPRGASRRRGRQKAASQPQSGALQPQEAAIDPQGSEQIDAVEPQPAAIEA